MAKDNDSTFEMRYRDQRRLVQAYLALAREVYRGKGANMPSDYRLSIAQTFADCITAMADNFESWMLEEEKIKNEDPGPCQLRVPAVHGSSGPCCYTAGHKSPCKLVRSF